MLFLIFHVATHSSRVPTSGSQTGDTLGKALASVSVKGVVVKKKNKKRYTQLKF